MATNNIDDQPALSLNDFSVKIFKTEMFNPNVYNKIINHDGISQEEKRKLKLWHKQKYNGNKVDVVYDFSAKCKKDGFARVYANKGLSLSTFVREIRNALAADYYWDLDMVNAHPTILLKMCKEKSWVCDCLERYVNDRQEVLKEIDEHYQLILPAKQTINSLVYLGGVPMLKNKDDEYDYLLKFRIEMSKIAENIKDANPKIFKLVSKNKNSEREMLSSCMSYVLTTEEHKILTAMNNYLESNGRNVDILMYDGCGVRKKNGEPCFPQKVMEDCEAHILEATKYPIKLAIKPMDTTLQWDEEVDPNELLYKTMGYPIIKEQFEATRFKVKDPICYCEEKNGKIVMRSSVDMKEVYTNLYCIVKIEADSKDGRTVFYKQERFISEWFADPNIRTYEDMNIYPPPMVCPEGTYNMWKGFSIQKSFAPSSNNLQPFFTHLNILVNGNEAGYHHMIKWLAQLFQQAGHCCLCLEVRKFHA